MQVRNQGVGWNYNGYRYGVYELRLSGDPNDLNPGHIDGRTCLPPDERVITAQELAVDGNVLPLGIELGVPPHPVVWPDSGFNNGVWQSNSHAIKTPDPGVRPPILARSYGRSAAAVDDSGRLVIRNAGGAEQQIFCVGMGGPNCAGQSIRTTSTRQGAGVLLREDNCPNGTLDPAGQNDPTHPGTYSINCAAASSWYKPPAGTGNLDLTGFIGTEANGTLKSFVVNFDAYNTQENGFSVAAFVTLKYPITSGPGGYNNVATIDVCGGQATTVQPGDTICFKPGMNNVGASTADDVFVEMDWTGVGQPETYLAPTTNPPPSTGDPVFVASGYDAGTMVTGERQNHYWWWRSSSPGNLSNAAAWSVQYQPTRFQVKAGTPAGTQLCFRTLVNPATPAGSFSASEQKCIGVGVPGQIPVNCQDSNLPASGVVEVSLPDKSPNSPSAPVGTYSYVPGVVYYQDIRGNNGQGKTKVLAVSDNSSGGVPTSPTLVSESYQKANVSYAPYVTAYPFDMNKSSVTYASYYDRTTWKTATTPSSYECPSGWQPDSNPAYCKSFYPATLPSCGGGETLIYSPSYGYLCQYVYYATPTYSSYYGCGPGQTGPYLTMFGYLCQQNGVWAGGQGWYTYVSGWSCPQGGTQYGGACYYGYRPAGAPSCPQGGSYFLDPNYGYLCTRTQNAQPRYNWSKTGPEKDQLVIYTQYDTFVMTPCYKRTYTATPVLGSAQMTPSRENPSNVSITGEVRVDFGVANPSAGQDPMRQPTRINNLPYVISYYIERNNNPLTEVTAASGTVNAVATNNNRNSPGASVTPNSVSAGINVSIPQGSIQVGDRVCWRLYTTSRTGQSQTSGTVDVNGNFSGSGQDMRQSCTGLVINEPYMRVYGGDVLAGSGFGVGCAVNTSASIIAWNRGDGGGSAVQFAAQAAAAITDFTSATGRGPAPTQPKGLSFANTSGTYGGSFGAGQCAKDYFANATNVQPSGYTSNGSTVALGARQVVYVNGDAFIRGNIIYAGNGSWANLSQIPSYYLVARGNIYISEQVTQLDGVYIAQPAANGSGGRIYTCVNHDTRLVMSSSPDAHNRCQNKLTINGAFVAKQVRFLRARGSIRDSSANEPSTSGTISEVFNYSPELFLINPGVMPQPARQYESASGLPPVL